MKRVVILQANYIPWKGYFDLIDLADEFVFLDAQYTARDWRNRNLIKTPIGLQWLTVPVTGRGLISEMKIDGDRWMRQHWNSLESNYARAPYFQHYAPALHDLFLSGDWGWLSDLNDVLTRFVCRQFDITTPLNYSEAYPTKAKKTQRLVDICRQTGATHYLSGPAAKDYLDESLFGDIKVEWMTYDYPEYPQLYGDFVHAVSILDVLFNVGPDKRYIQTRADIRGG